MAKISYQGGSYDGSVTRLKGNGRLRGRIVPNGFGVYCIDDVVYSGYWKKGFEHGLGIIRWSNGQSFVGYFRDGYVEPNVLQRERIPSFVLEESADSR